MMNFCLYVLYVLSVACQLAGAETLLIIYFSHFGLNKTYDAVHRDDGNYGDEDDEAEMKKLQDDAKKEVIIARLTALYVLIGYLLAVVVDKPQDAKTITLIVSVLIVTAVLVFPAVFFLKR